MRVLVVDDEIDTAELIAESLRLNGHDVAVAYDAHDALNAVTSFMAAIVLLDIALPWMDGYEVARRMIATGFAGHLIAITWFGRDEDRARSAGTGFAGHLVKPVTTEAILSVIRDRVRRGRPGHNCPRSRSRQGATCDRRARRARARGRGDALTGARLAARPALARPPEWAMTVVVLIISIGAYWPWPSAAGCAMDAIDLWWVLPLVVAALLKAVGAYEIEKTSHPLGFLDLWFGRPDVPQDDQGL